MRASVCRGSAGAASALGEIPLHARITRGQEDLRSLLLGFDVDPHDERRVLDDYLAARATAPEDGHQPLAGELKLLDVFADLAELSRKRSAGEEAAVTATCTAPASTSTPTCRAWTSSGPACRKPSRPSSPRRSATTVSPNSRPPPISRPLCFGSFSPSSARPPTPKPSRRCCARGCGSRRRTRHCASSPVSRWSGWWRRPRSASPWSATWRAASCSPGSANRCCTATAPVSTRASASIYATWTRTPDAPDRAERIAEMVHSTEPLVRLLGQRLVRDNLDNTVMLKVLTRRRRRGPPAAARRLRLRRGRSPLR